MKHLDVWVTGKVQGVWFRASTKETADRLGLVGTVRNEPDGSVSVEAEGDEETLAALLQWLHEGPPLAEVSGVNSRFSALKHYKEFTISR